MMDLRAGRSPWIPIAAAAASALLPKNHLREIEKVPDSNKSFITTTFAKYPSVRHQISATSKLEKFFLAQFCELETKPAQAYESPHITRSSRGRTQGREIELGCRHQ
jgi:hypothetical protein